MGPLEIAIRVIDALDDLGIPYVLGGSLASSLVGEPRSTADVDLAIRGSEADVGRLVRTLAAEFYVSEEAATDAVRRSGSFNLVHLESVQKVDVFVLGDGPLDRRQIERRRRIRVVEDPPRDLWIGAPEDQILRKLAWYREGGGVSDRQWRDVLGIIAVQADRLDVVDLRAGATELGLAELLERALGEAQGQGGA